MLLLRLGASSRAAFIHTALRRTQRAAAGLSSHRLQRCMSSSSGADAAAAAAPPPPTRAPAQGDEVRAAVSPGGLGVVTLARDGALNALGAAHVEAVRAALLDWATQPGVAAVLLESSSARAFCSGGDVKAARQAVLDAPYTDAPPPRHHIHRVFRAEYSTVLLAAAYPKPLVALAQGIWMGLGFGLAGFASHVIVSDTTLFAMPEGAIGLWPDVGFAFAAARMPVRHAGLFLGLTGVRLSSVSDLLHFGIATHYVPSERLPAFRAALAASPAALPELLAEHSRPPPDSPGPLERLMPALQPHLQQLVQAVQPGVPGSALLQAVQQLADSMQEELPRVRAHDHQAGELLQHAITSLAYGSPASHAITARHFCRVADAVQQQQQQQQQQQGSAGNGGGRASASCCSYPLDIVVDGTARADLATLQGVMQAEYAMAVRQVAHMDFLEGVRAALVDKDRSPAWAACADGERRSTHQQPLPGNCPSTEHLFQPL